MYNVISLSIIKMIMYREELSSLADDFSSPLQMESTQNHISLTPCLGRSVSKCYLHLPLCPLASEIFEIMIYHFPYDSWWDLAL